MATILIRTVIIYIVLIVTMRIMGKRQLGELEISELVTTLLISEIASLPIADHSIPLTHALIPLITILALEVILSVILLKCPKLKNLVSARPTVLIRHGTLDQKEMRRIRISLDELISEIRQSGACSPGDVDYAILEQNGKLSIILKREASAPTANDLKMKSAEPGIMHALIEDGHINDYNLNLLKRDRDWLSRYLQSKNKNASDIFYLGMNDGEEFYCIDKERDA
ncbi:MAG: DUF421 domain-containing protein [Clostridia bacterium]|nr:DUF421 domain-containing protein [Clostridia bacterium]